jgi:hypothetical protein
VGRGRVATDLHNRVVRETPDIHSGLAHSCGALCKLGPFPRVWRYCQVLLPHGSLVPGGLRQAWGVAGVGWGGDRVPSGRPAREGTALPPSDSPLHGSWGWAF